MRFPAAVVTLAALVLSGCPDPPMGALSTGAPPPAQTPAPSPDPVLSPEPILTEVPPADGPAPETPGEEPLSGEASTVDVDRDTSEADPARKESSGGGLSLLDEVGGDGVRIDQVDPSVGKARVKDAPRTSSSSTPPDDRPRPTQSKAPVREKKRPTRRASRVTVRTISRGERVDFQPLLVPGRLTLIEFGDTNDANWKRFSPQFEELVRGHRNAQMFRIIVPSVKSPVAKQYNVRRLPCYLLYEGLKLVANDVQTIGKKLAAN